MEFLSHPAAESAALKRPFLERVALVDGSRPERSRSRLCRNITCPVFIDEVAIVPNQRCLPDRAGLHGSLLSAHGRFHFSPAWFP